MFEEGIVGGMDMRAPIGTLAASSLIALSGVAIAQGGPPQVQPVQIDPARPDWENPAVFAIGKLQLVRLTNYCLRNIIPLTL